MFTVDCRGVVEKKVGETADAGQKEQDALAETGAHEGNEGKTRPKHEFGDNDEVEKKRAFFVDVVLDVVDDGRRDGERKHDVE